MYSVEKACVHWLAASVSSQQQRQLQYRGKHGGGGGGSAVWRQAKCQIEANRAAFYASQRPLEHYAAALQKQTATNAARSDCEALRIKPLIRRFV